MKRLSANPLLALVAVLGCGPRAAPGPPGPAAPAAREDACALAAGAGDAVDTFTVALAGPVDPAHAPAPRTAGERLVFRQLYETLVRADCEGRAAPGLAESWTGDQGGQRWTFSLRGDARFWDGAPVTARDVAAGWRAGDTAGIVAVLPTAPRTVSVVLARGVETPLRLADPALAVRKPAPDGGWPIGTGAFWVTAATASAESILAQPVAGGPPPIVFREPSAADPRDLLDQRVDLVVTGDPATLAYAAGRGEFAAIPLPWERTYVLVAPARIGDGPLAGGTGFRAGLERAVRTDARPAAGPFWWDGRCDGAAATDTPPRPAPAARRVAYARGDRTARDLADRLVALGALAARTVTALGPEEFEAALRAGGEWAYVAALPARVLDPCGAARDLVPRGYAATLVPLVDTRAHAIVRRGAARLTVEWDGTIRVRAP